MKFTMHACEFKKPSPITVVLQASLVPIPMGFPHIFTTILQ